MLQLDDAGARVVAFEIQDVADVGPAPAVDRLILVADDGDAARAVGQKTHEAVLHVVGVLKFVDEHMIEKLGQGRGSRAVGLAQVERREQQAAEVDRAGGGQALFVQTVGLAHDFVEVVARGILIRGGALVFRAIDHREHLADGKGLFGNFHIGQHARHEPARIVVVVDDEFLADADGRAVEAQKARGNAVEGTQPHAVGAMAVAAEQALDALFEFARGLVGEGHSQDLARVCALGQQVGQAVGDHARLARAGPGDDQQRPWRIEHGLDLRWVQFAAERVRREAASWFARRGRKRVRRFHAEVIQTALAPVDRLAIGWWLAEAIQDEAEKGVFWERTLGGFFQTPAVSAVGQSPPALARFGFLAKMPAEVLATRAAHGKAPGEAGEPRVFQAVWSNDGAADGVGETADVKQKARWIHESVLVRTVHGDAMFWACDRGAARGADDGALGLHAVIQICNCAWLLCNRDLCMSS